MSKHEIIELFLQLPNDRQDALLYAMKESQNNPEIMEKMNECNQGIISYTDFMRYIHGLRTA